MAAVMDMKKITAIMALIILTAILLHAQEKKHIEKMEKKNKDMLLTEIAADITAYKTKTLTLRLKLKFVDRIFEKISFYDRKNHDIDFDISSKQTKKLIARDMLNLHEGMDYLVSFTVRNIDNTGGIVADLLGFKPALLDDIPD
jgi:hypothetical protein